MTPVTMGFLSPYSSIYPYFGPHLQTGFYLGLDQDPNRKTDIEIIPEFSGTGSIREVESATKKLLQFNNVDILSGMIGYKSLPDIVPLIAKRNKTSFFFDMGELLPPNEPLGDGFFFNSLQLYQSEYALGYWAQKEFSGIGSLVMPIYNAGYNLNVAFQAGVGAAGGDSLLVSTIHHKHDDPHHLDIEAIMKKLRQEAPAYVHAIFVGPQGNEFMEAWKAETWTKDIPLLVAENMLYEDMLGDIQNLGLDLYGATSWNANSEDKHNVKFVKKFKENTGQSANIYALLGYEAGLLFKEWLPYLKKRDWDTVWKGFSQTVLEGPRGPRKFVFENDLLSPEIDIVKVSCRNERISSLVIDRGTTLSQNDNLLNPFDDGFNSGWVNPYLCI